MNHKISDFKEDLRWSELPSQYIPYMRAISLWFPNTTEWGRIVDLVQQKNGKDIKITLSNGDSVNIQLKSRRSYYDDVCVEYRHDFDAGYVKPGWIKAPSDADFLIYCTPKRVYLLNYKQLHSAWKEYERYWIPIYKLKPVKNNGYVTRNAAVPFSELKAAGVDIKYFDL